MVKSAVGPAVVAASGVLLALVGCADSEPEAKAVEVAAVQDAGGPPPGMRWESYEDVRLAVPDDWGYGTTGSSWCLSEDVERGLVGRPGFDPLSDTCPGRRGVDPGEVTRVGAGGEYVWFGVEEPSAEPVRVEKRLSGPMITGDRAVIQVGVVRVYVQAEAEVRQKILGSISFQDVDHHGCPAGAPYAGNPTWRPAGPAVTGITTVQSLTACRYQDARLLSSLRLNGSEAAEVVAAITRAPAGGGPFHPAALCGPVEDEAESVEQLVVQVDAATHATIGVRYGGCSSTGIDDGTTVRTLTRESVWPLVQGPNRFTGQLWEGVSDLLTEPS